MGATLVKIKVGKKSGKKKPLSPLQKKLLAGPIMSDEEYEDYKKNNRSMLKWKI